MAVVEVVATAATTAVLVVPVAALAVTVVLVPTVVLVAGTASGWAVATLETATGITSGALGVTIIFGVFTTPASIHTRIVTIFPAPITARNPPKVLSNPGSQKRVGDRIRMRKVGPIYPAQEQTILLDWFGLYFPPTYYCVGYPSYFCCPADSLFIDHSRQPIAFRQWVASSVAPAIENSGQINICNAAEPRVRESLHCFRCCSAAIKMAENKTARMPQEQQPLASSALLSEYSS